MTISDDLDPGMRPGSPNLAVVEEAQRAPVSPTDIAGGVGQIAFLERSAEGLDPARFELLNPETDIFRKVLDKETRELIIDSDVGPEHYDQLAEELGPWAVADMAHLRGLAARLNTPRPVPATPALEGVVIPTIEEYSSTAKGGGVQMILTTQVNLCQKLGVDMHWRLMVPNDDAFRVTKDRHNTYQGVASPSIEDIDAGDVTYQAWIDAENADPMAPAMDGAHINTFHDPQPSGLMVYPDSLIAWRSHIQNRSDLIDIPGTPQHYLWQNMWQGKVERAHAHVFHPVRDFVPEGVSEETVVAMPATFDPFDDLNRRNLVEAERVESRAFINGELEDSVNKKFAEAPEGLDLAAVGIDAEWDSIDWEQTGIDWDRPIIGLIARFDPSKGMPEAMAAYARAREMMVNRGVSPEKLPQMVILGNGAVDDPDGDRELAKMMAIRSEIYGDIKDDIKVMRVPHNDVALNSFMDEADLGLQSSLFEGFETRASDWIWHGKPVIVSARGGLPLQVIEGKSGYVIDPLDTEQWARRITDIMTNAEKHKELCDNAEELGKTYNYREFSTVANAIRWLELYNNLLDSEPTGDWEWQISHKVAA